MKNLYVRAKDNAKITPQTDQQKKQQTKIKIQVEKGGKSAVSGLVTKNVSKEKKTNTALKTMGATSTIKKNHSKNSSINFAISKEKPNYLSNKEEYKKTMQSKFSDDTRVTVENSMVHSKVVSFKHEKRKFSVKKVGSTYDSSLKNSINFGLNSNSTNIEKETICFRNNQDDLKNTINVITCQSTEKDKDSMINMKSTIEEKDEIIQRLTNKILCLEDKIKTYQLNNADNIITINNLTSSTGFKNNKKQNLNSSFLSNKSSSNLNFGKNNNIPQIISKNMIFNVEVSKNFQEKLASKAKLNINTNFSTKTTSPKVKEIVLSPMNSNVITSKTVGNYINNHYKRKNDVSKTKSFEITNQLNLIRDKTRSVLEKYHNCNVALMVKIRSMSSNNNSLFDNGNLELK